MKFLEMDQDLNARLSLIEPRIKGGGGNLVYVGLYCHIHSSCADLKVRAAVSYSMWEAIETCELC